MHGLWFRRYITSLVFGNRPVIISLMLNILVNAYCGRYFVFTSLNPFGWMEPTSPTEEDRAGHKITPLLGYIFPLN